MKFDLDEMRSDEAMSYLGLTKVQDAVGSVESIQELRHESSTTKQRTREARTSKEAGSQPNRIQPQTSKIVTIEEIDDSGEDIGSDGDLLPYEKPDDDMEDDDDDPTLVQRNKPSAPV